MKSLSASHTPVNLVDLEVGLATLGLEFEPHDGGFLEFTLTPFEPHPLPPDEVCCKDMLGHNLMIMLWK